MTKNTNEYVRLSIKIKNPETMRAFKRAAADFRTYEDLIAWLGKNYQAFVKIVPPYPVHGGVL